MGKEIAVTYDDLVAISGRSIQQVKRCALRLREGDPENRIKYPTLTGGRGLIREHHINDGFYVILMAGMVADYGMKIEEAGKHILPIARQMENLNLLPSVRWDRRDPVPRIELRIHPGHVYEYRTYAKRNAHEAVEDENWDTGEQTVNDPYIARWVPKKSMGNSEPGHVYEIPLTALLGHYMLSLRRLKS